MLNKARISQVLCAFGMLAALWALALDIERYVDIDATNKILPMVAPPTGAPLSDVIKKISADQERGAQVGKLVDGRDQMTRDLVQHWIDTNAQEKWRLQVQLILSGCIWIIFMELLIVTHRATKKDSKHSP